ncbi:MAG TPA: serine/threonine-protein kinase, partial [Coleofasciculaceae cyanobacterium]
LRGSVTSPKQIVILAIDEESLAQGQFYQSDPQTLAYLEPLKTWPWKREVYGTVINRLIAAGAKSVALDIILDRPSSYGQADDEMLRQALQTHAGKVTLAASYEDAHTRQGGLTQLIQPNSIFQTNPMSVGSINYPMERNGRVHRLASQFPKVLAQSYPNQAKEFYEFVATVPSFDQATLKAAGLNYPQPKGDNIFFYGPPGTFEIIPFWYVLEPSNWKGFLKNGQYFKDKIVLIGGTATLFQDYHPTPFSESWLYPEPMSGVEIHANAIATLLEGRSIAEAIPNPTQQGLFVFIGVIGAGFLSTRLKKGPLSIAIAIGVAITWGGVSYLCFVYGRLILPTAVPVFVIALSGFSYGTIGAIQDYLTKRNLRRTLKHYASAPIVQEIIAQQNELQDLLQEKEQEILGQTLGGRYKIIALLSSGGFGETYIAEDMQRPGNPRCVVKQLKPVSNSPQRWLLAERLFIKEAEILERLGKHNQIPQLLAYFKDKDEFYLIEELIVGHPLSQEMPVVLPLEEVRVIRILRDLLPLLEFVHSQGVIHRDIKPENIIRRQSDDKLVLIDFGAVKEIRTQLAEGEEQSHFTVGIGTKGYMPSEQSAGSPRYNSDLYAVGMIAVQALTAIHPSRLQEDPETGDIIWQNRAQVSPQLAAIINKMIRCNFRDRYQSATEILEALQPLIATLPADSVTHPTQVDKAAQGTPSLQDSPNATAPWPESFTPSETQEVTMPWSGASTPPEVEDVTMPWSDSTAAISQTLSTESFPFKEVKQEGLECQD